ncbi:MAG TPA: UDP-N-acetylmuramoyl-tripeptide--D-alanyl-D-alanine ligase, partial [Phaeodactylibacter sp.]|nr:UDP-N-acetylmuramoyl-tripeptide--D-alanyl-D-alanine ligase [Phaeodactylibacter sp.]
MIDIQELYKHYLTHPNIITDSRKIEQGCIFFSLKGPHFNGNQYAKEAIDKGAAFAVVDENEYAVGQQYILVKDVLSSLQALARYHRQQFSMPLLAITGSNGKTTTKELL